jgi:DNA-binding MltR family transcriptional regulator
MSKQEFSKKDSTKKEHIIPIPTELYKQSQEFLGALARDDDVACILLGCSFIDQCLASLLQEFLISGDNSKAILHYKGALGELFTRARLAYCLGLIPKTMLQDLQTMAEIRNILAHDFLKASFANEKVANLCEGLPEIELPEEYRKHEVISLPADQQMPTMKMLEAIRASPRRRFIITSVLLAETLLLMSVTTTRQERHPGYGANGSWYGGRARLRYKTKNASGQEKRGEQ